MEQLANIQSTYTKYKKAVEDVTDSKLKTELVEQIEERFESCTKLYDNDKYRLSLYAPEKDPKNQNVVEILLMSIRPITLSQFTGRISVSSSKIVARQIEASRRRGSVSSSQRVRELLATADRHRSDNLDTETKRGALQGKSGYVSPEFNNVILPGNNMGYEYHINQGRVDSTPQNKMSHRPIDLRLLCKWEPLAMNKGLLVLLVKPH